MELRKYRKKPVVIEAVKLTTENVVAVCDMIHGYNPDKPTYTQVSEEGLVIPTLEGNHLARFGDMVIKGVANEWYPCKMDIFVKTYEEAGE